MQPLSAHHQHRINVTSEHDVIAMRQEVRQVARSIGLGLVEQAKIATAISAVARVMLALCEGTLLVLRMGRQGDQSVLEITCTPVRWTGLVEVALLEEQLNLANARLLVDEANLAERGGEPILTLRMRLARSAR